MDKVLFMTMLHPVEDECTIGKFLNVISEMEEFVTKAKADKDFINKAIEHYDNLVDMRELYLLSLRGKDIILNLKPADAIRVTNIIDEYSKLIIKVNNHLQQALIDCLNVVRINIHNNYLSNIPTDVLKAELKSRDK